MSLAAGSKLGPYEILAPIGAGGMGEVYRARDTKLKRDVALKVLPAAFANDPDRMARFQREAEVLASLNHPNIAHIYGIAESDTARALVMELVEGESPRGPMPFEEAWKIAAQIAAALEYAHDKGIIHRDLKPANVKVTPEGVVKLLDFGLAKAFRAEAVAPTDAENSPTLTMGATQAGVILGTAAYMSPEQAKGKTVDKRADIWSFGVVLYELLTGERLFKGEDISEILAHVLTQQPDLDKTPVHARKLLRRCLEKDPKKRMRDIGDASDLLDVEQAIGLHMRVEGPLHKRLPWAVAALAIMALAAVAFLHFRETPASEPVTQLSISLPENFLVAFFALSPDGRTVVIGGRGKLWIRTLDSPQLRPLSNTDNARNPFWSPDSRSIGFFAAGKLKIIPASGGPATSLCDAGDGGGTWSRGGVILFSAGDGSIQRVSEGGGACTPVTKPEPGVVHRVPVFLPDGKKFLYVALGGEDSKRGVHLAGLDNPTPRRLLADPSSAIFAAPRSGGSRGHLLFQREGILMAQPFDSGTLQLTGDPFQVVGSLSPIADAPQVPASVAGNATLVVLEGPSRDESQVTWLDRRTGKELAKVGEPGPQRAIALSPDQKEVALVFLGSAGSKAGVWLRDLARGGDTRFAAASAAFISPPVWSHDGRIAISSADGIYVKDAAHEGQEKLVLKGGTRRTPSDWSRDGKYLLYTESDPKTRGDIWYLPLDPSGKPGEPKEFLKTESMESQGQFSPDGHWVAYTSDESGQNQVYIRPFPGLGKEQEDIDRRGAGTTVEGRWQRALLHGANERRAHPPVDGGRNTGGAGRIDRSWSASGTV